MSGFKLEKYEEIPECLKIPEQQKKIEYAPIKKLEKPYINRLLYLAQRYTGIEREAWDLAFYYTNRLLELGYTVFSPILHTHNFHEELFYKLVFHHDNTVNNLMHMQKHPLAECSSEDCPVKQIKLPDYLQWDLNILDKIKDGRLVIVMAHTAFRRLEGGRVHWLSKGAYEEYLWAIDKGVPVVELDPLLEGRVVPI